MSTFSNKQLCLKHVFSILTIRAFPLLRRAMRTGEEHFGGGTPIGHLHIQAGEGDGVLDDGRNDRRWRRQLFASSSRSVFRSPSDLTERPGEERSDLVVWTGDRIRFPVVPVVPTVPIVAVVPAVVRLVPVVPFVPSASMVAEEGSVPEDIASTANMHGVAEISQRRADHLQREVAFIATLAVRL